MLPNHQQVTASRQPLVVAEQFSMLEGLFARRVDFGLGRSFGFTPPVRDALRIGPEGAGTFERDLRDLAALRGHLDGTGDVTARTRTNELVLATALGTWFWADETHGANNGMLTG